MIPQAGTLNLNQENMDVVCALIVEGDKILGTRRAAGLTRAGKWEFPGGKVRQDELPEKAIIREIDEELGIQVAVVHRLPGIVHKYPDITIRLIPFICKIRQGDIRLTDHDEYSWIPVNKLFALDWSEADKNLILLIQESTEYLNGPIV